MPKLCNIDIDNRQGIFKRLEKFVITITEKFSIKNIYLYGSFATGEIHEGSDIDLIIIGDFKERFFDRIGKILRMTDLPIEPLVYTESEFKGMLENGNPFLKDIIEKGRKLI